MVHQNETSYKKNLRRKRSIKKKQKNKKTSTSQVGVTSVEDLVWDVEVGGRHGPVLHSEGVAQ